MYANTASIDELAEFIANDGDYPTRNGFRRLDSPSFIFKDERNCEDGDTLYGRELALDFEEWVERQNQRESYLKGELIPAFVPCDKSGLEFILATMDEVEEWMDKPTKNKKPVMVSRDKDGVLHEWAPKTPEEAEAYFGRQESRELSNWLVGWHKRRPANNDHWRKLVMPLMDIIDDKTLGLTAQTILRTMRDTLPFAPGPAKSTVFINPDKTRAVTSLEPGKAKAGFIQRHGIQSDLVTMDRVQYVKERVNAKGQIELVPDGPSRYVIGTRKDSSKTPSNYYDPDPIKGDKGYVPRACNLMRLNPKSPVMPDEHCYRLTVRELERAIIAGANLCEDELDALASTFDNEDSQFDTREAGISFDDSCDFRTQLDLDEQEQWLYWILVGAGMEDAAKAMLVANAGDIARFLPGLDGALIKLGTDQELTDDEEIAQEILERARIEDVEEMERYKRLQWSRYDYLRNLGSQQCEDLELVQYREMVNDAFEINIDVINNNTVGRDNELRFPDKAKRPAYLSW